MNPRSISRTSTPRTVAVGPHMNTTRDPA